MEKIKKISQMAHKNIFPSGINGAEERWLKKAILKRKVLYDGTSLENVRLNGDGVLSLEDLKSSYFARALCVKASTTVENINPRPRISLSFNWDNLDLSAYNRVEVWVYPEAVGYHNFYYHFSIGNSGSQLVHAPSLEANKWNRVIWEISQVKRDEVTGMGIVPALMGTPPEALGEIKIYISHIEVQSVEAEDEEGWDLANRLAYSYSGYLPHSQKIALSQTKIKNFSLLNKENNIVYQDEAKVVQTKLGKFYELDFSAVNKQGIYKLVYNNEETPFFPISNNSYNSSIWKSLNFLRSLRCGEDVEGVHSACHLNCRTVHPNKTSVPNFGGWHDAGDLSQFLIPTAEITSALFDLSNKVKDKDLAQRLVEEAKIGSSWLLRTRFGDGYRAMAVLYNYWRSNILDDDNLTVKHNQAENGSFENFLASYAELKAYLAFKNIDEIYADWCYRAALEDYQFAKYAYRKGIHTKRWGPTIQSQTAGSACLVASELYHLTQDEAYLKDAVFYAKIVLKTQETNYPAWEKPMRGFFYEDVNHEKMLSYEHRGHEQSPIQGLVRFYEVAPEHELAPKVFESIKLYREYIVSTINYSAPYGLLPAHIYDLNKINIERFTVPKSYGDNEKALEDLKNQAKTGFRLNEDVYLRLMPIAIQRRGYLATLLSKTKAVSLIAALLNDDQLRQIALDQIEWTLGKNPFASSQMYGEGYNYHPLYVAYSKQIVGALPVGFKTLGYNDAPYWPVANNAVYKEVWGHTSGKYLWVLADLI